MVGEYQWMAMGKDGSFNRAYKELLCVSEPKEGNMFQDFSPVWRIKSSLRDRIFFGCVEPKDYHKTWARQEDFLGALCGMKVEIVQHLCYSCSVMTNKVRMLLRLRLGKKLDFHSSET